MKINTLLATTAMIVSLSAAGVAYADDSTPDTAAPHASHDSTVRYPGWHNYMEHIISQLPEDKAKLYRDTMHKAHEDNQALFDQGNKLKDELNDILTADKFDKKAYLEKNKELEEVRTKVEEHLSEAFVTVASQFTQDERKVLAKLRHRPQMKHHDGASKPDSSPK